MSIQHKRLVKGNVPKKDVNCRRINRERMRHKLALASFVCVPRLVKVAA
jgi:hypothetical protein